MPAKRDLNLFQGDDYAHVVTFEDAAGAPFPMPGTYLAQIRLVYASAVLATFTVDVTDQATGVLRLHLPAAVVASLPEAARWDLQRTSDGVVSTLLYGAVNTQREVTRV